jgi:hypothetical protein
MLGLSTRLAAPIVLVCALALCGCGVSGKKSPSRNAAFVSRANAICAKATKRAHALSRSDPQMLLERADSILAQADHELRAVRAPANKRAAYETFVTGVEAEARRVDRLARAVRENDRSLYRATTKEMSSDSVNHEAFALGLNACGETVEPSG